MGISGFPIGIAVTAIAALVLALSAVVVAIRAHGALRVVCVVVAALMILISLDMLYVGHGLLPPPGITIVNRPAPVPPSLGLYLTGPITTGLNRDITALRATDGSVAWALDTNRPLVYDAGEVYEIPQVGPQMRITARSANDGRVLWTSVDLRGPASEPRVIQSGEVVAAAGMLYVGTVIAANGYGGYLAALDAATGTLRWNVPLPGEPRGIAVADGAVYVGFNGTALGLKDGLLALDTATGATRWRLISSDYLGYADPPVVGNVVFATSVTDKPCDFGCAEHDYVNALNASDGTFYWRVPLAWAGSPLAVG